jgi:hypothetical protein
MILSARLREALNKPPSDPLLTAFKANKNEFRWINHTLEHPNLDCATATYTANQITRNQTSFNANLGPVAAGLNDPTELVTGEHSGLANTRPGNPGTIDPPGIFAEPSALEAAFAIFANVLEVDADGRVLNFVAAEQRAAEVISSYYDPSFVPDRSRPIIKSRQDRPGQVRQLGDCGSSGEARYATAFARRPQRRPR